MYPRPHHRHPTAPGTTAQPPPVTWENSHVMGDPAAGDHGAWGGGRGGLPPQTPAARALPFNLAACRAAPAAAQAAVGGPPSANGDIRRGRRGKRGADTKFGGEIRRLRTSGTGREGQPCHAAAGEDRLASPLCHQPHRVTLGQAVGGAVPRSAARRASPWGRGDGAAWDRAAPGAQRERALNLRAGGKLHLEGGSSGAANSRAAPTPSPAVGDSVSRSPTLPQPAGSRRPGSAERLQLAPVTPAASALPASVLPRVPAGTSPRHRRTRCPSARRWPLLGPRATAGEGCQAPVSRVAPAASLPLRTGCRRLGRASPGRLRTPKPPRQRPRFLGPGPTDAFGA